MSLIMLIEEFLLQLYNYIVSVRLPGMEVEFTEISKNVGVVRP